MKTSSTPTSKPLISVIMATYNRAHLLPRAIRSVLNQTYKDFEIIVVDDGSTDSTEEVVKTFQDRRILYYKQGENKGMLAARNKGFDVARGDYVTLLDDDDELLPEALEVAINKLNELSERGVKFVWFDHIDAETQEVCGYGMNEDGYVSYEDCLCGRICGDFWIVIDKKLIGSDNRFNERLWDHESLLFLKLHRKCKVFYVHKTLAISHRKHGGNISDFENQLKHLQRVILTQKAFLEEYGEELRHLCPKAYRSRLFGLGFYYILNGDKLEGRRILLKSFALDSWIKVIALLLSSILNKRQIAFCYRGFLALKGHR